MSVFGRVPGMFPRNVSSLFACLALVILARAEAPPTNRYEKEIAAYEAA